MESLPATYGPPNAANFTDGPITIPSGATTDILAGSDVGQAGVVHVLFMIAIDPADLASLGSITFQVDDESVILTAADFVDPGDAGFPSDIEGIGDDPVNGISFPDAVVAGVLCHTDEDDDLDSLTPPAEDSDIGDFTLTTPVDARVDLFTVGFGGVLIIKNSPGSRSLGVTAPEPLGLALVGAAAALMVRRRR